MENKPQTTLPEMCRQCHLFFANPDLGAYCSKCFKDLNIKPPVKTENASEEKKSDSAEKQEPKENVIKQTDHSLCWTCEKKVGLFGFKCKCEYSFCKKHRMPEKHECEFDYRKEGQRRLKKDNVGVKNAKVEKI